MHNLKNGTKETEHIPCDDYCSFKRRLEIRLQIRLSRNYHVEPHKCIFQDFIIKDLKLFEGSFSSAFL